MIERTDILMTELSSTFVCIMGMGTVFIGLILIVLICKLLSLVTAGLAKSTPAAAKPITAPAANTSLPMPSAAEKASILAAVCACIAEEVGTDADNIKVTSFKRV